jgi:hypothetical protein
MRVNDYFQVKCDKCEYGYVMYDYIEPSAVCKCEGQLKAYGYEDITDAEEILDIIECELENANYHKEYDLIRPLYEKLKNNDNDYTTARSIATVFYDYI